MAISLAVQRGNTVFVYGEQGQMLSTIMGGTEPQDGVLGYTSSTVTVRRGNTLFIYNEKGNLLSTTYAR
jgi:hypothetical protein